MICERKGGFEADVINRKSGKTKKEKTLLPACNWVPFKLLPSTEILNSKRDHLQKKKILKIVNKFLAGNQRNSNSIQIMGIQIPVNSLFIIILSNQRAAISNSSIIFMLNTLFRALLVSSNQTQEILESVK